LNEITPTFALAGREREGVEFFVEIDMGICRYA